MSEPLKKVMCVQILGGPTVSEEVGQHGCIGLLYDHKNREITVQVADQPSKVINLKTCFWWQLFREGDALPNIVQVKKQILLPGAQA